MHQHKPPSQAASKPASPAHPHAHHPPRALALSFLTTQCLRAAGVESIVTRYQLAVLFSYLEFFILIARELDGTRSEYGGRDERKRASDPEARRLPQAEEF